MNIVHFLIVRHLAAPDEVEQHAAGHIAYLRKYHAAGVFLASGQTVPPADGGVIVASGPDRAAIEKIIMEDTFLQRGLSAYEVITVRVRRGHPTLVDLLDELNRAEPAR
jgi:uncharacterized protein YciI